MAVELSTGFSLAEDSLGLPCILAMALQSSVAFSYSIALSSFLHPYLGNDIRLVASTLYPKDSVGSSPSDRNCNFTFFFAVLVQKYDQGAATYHLHICQEIQTTAYYERNFSPFHKKTA
jgi:hypothetical protein